MHQNLTLSQEDEEYVKKLKKGWNGLKLVSFTVAELLKEIGDSVALGFPCADRTIDSQRHLQRNLPDTIYNNGIVGGPLIFSKSYPGYEAEGLAFFVRRAKRVVGPGMKVTSVPQPHWPCTDAIDFGIILPQIMEIHVPESIIGLKENFGQDSKVIMIFHQKRFVDGLIRQRSRRLLF